MPYVFLANGAEVRFTTLQSMVNICRDYSAGYFDLVISDECHRSIYGKWSGVPKHFDGVQIDLTATPCVADIQDSGDELDWSAMDPPTRKGFEELFGDRDRVVIDPASLAALAMVDRDAKHPLQPANACRTTASAAAVCASSDPAAAIWLSARRWLCSLALENRRESQPK